MLTRTRTSIVAIGAVLSLGLAACGSDVVSTDTLESEVAAQLEAQVGEAPDSVSCPDALAAEVGAETRCSLTSGDTTIGMTLTVTSVEDGQAVFDIVVDDAPEG